MADQLPAAPKPAVTPAQQAHLINLVRRAARAEILPRFRALSETDVSTKSGPEDLVTAADTAAEAMITRALQIAFPSALVVGEEAASRDPTLPGKIAEAPLAFILDPVDGTWNFAHGLGIFGVILAVTRFGRPEFGLIYDPLADDWVMAEEGKGAWFCRPLATPQRLRAAMGKPLDGLCGHIHFHRFQGEKQRRLAALLPTFRRTEALRCSAHEFRLLARGKVDFILTEGLKPWDNAAGALIAAEAGAHVEMLDGGPYTAARQEGHLLIAPDRATWNRMEKVLRVLLD